MASRKMTWCIVTPFALRLALTDSKICMPFRDSSAGVPRSGSLSHSRPDHCSTRCWERCACGDRNQGPYHVWIFERIPLLQQVDPQHGCQWIRSTAALLAGMGLVTLDLLDQLLPWHYYLHLSQELRPFGLLSGRGDSFIRAAELLATH